MRTRFRGITVREGVLLRGTRLRGAGLGGVEPVPGVRRRRRRAVAALRRGGRGRATGRRRCGTRCRSTSPCPPSGRSGRTRSCSPAAARTAKVKVAEPGQTLGRRRGPARGGARRARPGRPDPRRRQRRLGRRRRRSPRSGCWTAPPAAWSTSSSRARASRSWPPSAGPSTCRSPPTSRSAAPPTPTGCATSRPPTWPCSRCSRSAACAPACGSPRTSGCRWWSRRRWRRRSGSRPGVALAAALPELPYACGLATVQLLTDDVVADAAAAGRRRAAGRRAAASTRRRWPGSPPRRTGSRTGRPGWPRCGRCGAVRQDGALVTPLHRAGPRRRHRAGRGRRHRGRDRARLAQRAAVASRRTTPPRPGCCGCTPASTSARAGFLALGLTRGGARAAVMCTSGTARRQPAPGGARGRARRGAAGRRHRRPAGPAARHQRQPDHRPGRDLRPAGRHPGPSARRPERRRASPTARPGAPQRPARRPAAARGPLGARAVEAGRPRRAAPAARGGRSRCRRPAHRRGRRRRRRPAGAGAGRARGLAAARRAHQRLAHRRERAALLPAAARHRPRPRHRAGRGRAGTRPCPGRSPGCSPATDVEVVDAPASGVWAERPFRVDAGRSGATRARERGRPGLAGGVARRPTASVARQLDALLAAEPELTPHEVAGAVGRGAARRGAAGRRRVQPDPRPRPDGAALRGRRPPQGDRQPRPLRHRRRRSRRRSAPPSGRPAAAARARADGRRDLPARRQRAGPRSRRGPPGPDDRGRQRRRRLDLHDARAGRRGVRRAASTGSSAPRTASTWPPLRGDPDAALAGRVARASSSTRWPARTAAIEVVEVVVRRDNRRDLDARIRALRP